MKKLISLVATLFLTSCVSATLETDVVTTQSFNFASQLPQVPANVPGVRGTVSVTRDVDISEQLKDLNDPASGLTYELSVAHDELTAPMGLSAVDKLQLVADSGAQHLVLVDHLFTQTEKSVGSATVHVEANGHQLKNLLSQPTKFTMTVTGELGASFPRQLNNNLVLHMVATFKKSL